MAIGPEDLERIKQAYGGDIPRDAPEQDILDALLLMLCNLRVRLLAMERTAVSRQAWGPEEVSRVEAQLSLEDHLHAWAGLMKDFGDALRDLKSRRKQSTPPAGG